MIEFYRFLDDVINEHYLGRHNFDLFKNTEIDGYFMVQVGQDELLVIDEESYLEVVRDQMRHNIPLDGVEILTNYLTGYDSIESLEKAVHNFPASVYTELESLGVLDDFIIDYINTVEDREYYIFGTYGEYIHEYNGSVVHVIIREFEYDKMSDNWEFLGPSEDVI